MRYHYKPKKHYTTSYGQIYKCNHPVYDICTLYIINNKGLAVIQQRYDSKNKHTYWTNIDKCLTDAIYLNPNFYNYFCKYAKKSQNGIYPTITVRQLMFNLKMKPLKREIWETCFDKKPI